MLTKQPISLEKLRQLAEPGYLYAIVDACGVPAVPPKMQELGESEALSLFKGSPKEDYWAVAPYLLRVRPQTLAWIQESLWNDPWGIFLMSKASLEEIHRHFLGLLVVLKPDGRYWFFRYYDPRALETFLDTCSPAEAKSILGPARAFAITVKDSDQCMMFVGEEGGVLAHRFSVRREHEQVLDQAASVGFEFRLLNHLKHCFSERCATLGDKAVHQLMTYGLQSARSYGIHSERDLCRYVNVLFTLGPAFDRDPAIPWAQNILTDSQCSSAAEKVNRLYAATLTFRLCARIRETLMFMQLS